MNNPETQLKNCIHLEKGIIPSNTCDYILSIIKSRSWKPHEWYQGETKSNVSEETMELDVQPVCADLQNLITPYIIEAGKRYNSKYIFNGPKMMQIMNQFTPVRFNRYGNGQIMRQHYDHIHLGKPEEERKGIPILSFIGNLNDDYEGADLYFWDDYVVPLGKGDILMFPSIFLFPHGVTEAIKGQRYSFVSWAF